MHWVELLWEKPEFNDAVHWYAWTISCNVASDYTPYMTCNNVFIKCWRRSVGHCWGLFTCTIMSLEKLQTGMSVVEFSHCFSIRLMLKKESNLLLLPIMDNNLCTTAARSCSLLKRSSVQYVLHKKINSTLASHPNTAIRHFFVRHCIYTILVCDNIYRHQKAVLNWDRLMCSDVTS